MIQMNTCARCGEKFISMFDLWEHQRFCLGLSPKQNDSDKIRFIQNNVEDFDEIIQTICGREGIEIEVSNPTYIKDMPNDTFAPLHGYRNPERKRHLPLSYPAIRFRCNARTRVYTNQLERILRKYNIHKTDFMGYWYELWLDDYPRLHENIRQAEQAINLIQQHKDATLDFYKQEVVENRKLSNLEHEKEQLKKRLDEVEKTIQNHRENLFARYEVAYEDYVKKESNIFTGLPIDIPDELKTL